MRTLRVYLQKKLPSDNALDKCVIGSRKAKKRRAIVKGRFNFGPTVPRNFRAKEIVIDNLVRARSVETIYRYLTRPTSFVSTFTMPPFSAHVAEYKYLRILRDLKPTNANGPQVGFCNQFQTLSAKPTNSCRLAEDKLNHGGPNKLWIAGIVNK